MDVAIVVDSEDPQELSDLFVWLRREDELRGKVRLQSRPLGPDEMGTLPELIAIAIGGGGVVSVLASSLSTWLAHRKSDITLKVTGRDGRIVELTAQRVAEADELLREVLRRLGASSSRAPSRSRAVAGDPDWRKSLPGSKSA